MTKLWDSGSGLSREAELFTVGNDFMLDTRLVKYDCLASIAHVSALAKAGILTARESSRLKSEYQKIIKMGGKFKIKRKDEDCHTAIENHLVKKLGNIGKKVHTARSRNDQVKAALHLYMRDEITRVIKLAGNLVVRLSRVKNAQMPGYTHTRKAMPSSFKLWSDAFTAGLKDDIRILKTALEMVNHNPLGSGAGYGVPIKIDRNITKKALGFKDNMPVGYVQNSRGKIEAFVLHSMLQVMLDLSKMASDLILFSMPELGFVTLPDNLTTGSSIMPHKKNPDVLELVRASYPAVLGYLAQVEGVCGGLISGYHRDFQLTKEPLMWGIEITESCLKIMGAVVSGFRVNSENCRKALTDDIYSAQKAHRLVKKGMSFRDAYRKVKKELKKTDRTN